MNDMDVRLDAYAQKLINSFSEKKRVQVEKKIATMLRANMRSRITRQEDIHGKKFEPRQKQKYRIDKRTSVRAAPYKRKKKTKMLIGFRDKAWLKIKFEKDKFSVGYKAGRTGRTAEVHNEGQAQLIGGKQGEHWAQYPERRWIGQSDEDKEAIDEIIEDFLVL